ncbi:MAG: tetratricopeptide repeat protein [Deltaproteobacteria bacterium]|nr:tetratricopeptide repeat protein [Deltaproteobacteria bacterium]
MQRDIQLLQQQQAANQKSLSEQQARLEEQMQLADRKIAEVARTLEDLNRAARSTTADFGVQLERLIKDIQELRGFIELTEYRLGKIEAKLEGDNSIEKRLEALESGSVKETPPDKNAPNDKKEMLVYASDLLKQGKAKEARGVLRAIVRKWPNEKGVTDKAYYDLGETYFNDKKYRNAVQEFARVVEKFASGSYADQAYYKIGLCSMAIGNYEDAKIFFGEIIRNYKKSSLAKDAKKKLDEVQERLKKEANDKKHKTNKKSKT